jgi:hypothetical protein
MTGLVPGLCSKMNISGSEAILKAIKPRRGQIRRGPPRDDRTADARKAIELLATGTVAGKIVLVCDSASARADVSAFAEDAAKQLGGVLDADLLHDVGPVTLDGARA